MDLGSAAGNVCHSAVNLKRQLLLSKYVSAELRRLFCMC